MSNPTERYLKLGFNEALSRTYHYPIACKDLSLILREAYGKLPKHLQSIILQDILTAFRLLPKIETRSGVSAAHILLQSAEAKLPKQRKNFAVAEFKHAKVALKRRCKAHHEEETSGANELPQDILVHIFSFLDFNSLISVSQVCWSWNIAASNNQLWHSQYAIFFCSKHHSSKTRRKGRCGEKKEFTFLQENTVNTISIDRKEAFKKMYIGNSSKRLTSNRGYCGHCETIVWLDNIKCCNGDCKRQYVNQEIVPVSSHQVVDYLLNDWSSSTMSSSDSDSDSDEGLIPRLWAYPKHIG